MKRELFGAVLVCEHVIPGLGNKHSLINVYSGDILVEEFPARIMMGLYAEHFADKESGEMKLDIFLDSDLYASAVIKYSVKLDGSPGIVAIPSFDLLLNSEKNFKIVAVGAAPDEIVLIDKKILLNREPMAVG